MDNKAAEAYLVEQKTALNEQRKEIEAIGEARGMEKGKVEGLAEGIEKTAINMLNQNLDTKLISSVTGISETDLQRLKNKL